MRQTGMHCPLPDQLPVGMFLCYQAGSCGPVTAVVAKMPLREAVGSHSQCLLRGTMLMWI